MKMIHSIVNYPEYASRQRVPSSVFISHQGCIPIYRKSFYQRLGKFGTVNYVVVHGSAPKGSDLILASPPYDFQNIKVNNLEGRFAGRSWIWQPVVWRVLRGEFQAVVIGDEIKFLSNLAVAVIMTFRRRPVILWGFGYHQYHVVQESLLARISAHVAVYLKSLMYRFSSGYLVYTESGQKVLQNLPVPPKRIRVLKNTVDTEREAEFRALVSAEPIEDCYSGVGVRADSIKLTYFGRFQRAKCIDLLIKYARRCADRKLPVDVIIFGQGSEESRLHAMADGLSNVVFHTHDDMKLARALRISAAIVVPGFLGLAITHGFAHGVPTLTRLGQLHSPEIEYLHDKVNGLLLPESQDAFFDALDNFVGDRGLQERLAEGARQSAHSVDMTNMARTFHELVCECLATSGDSSKPRLAASCTAS